MFVFLVQMVFLGIDEIFWGGFLNMGNSMEVNGYFHCLTTKKRIFLRVW